MNTKIITILLLGFTFVCPLSAQQGDYQMKGNTEEITIDFLSSYYQQDGNNAAVTGGVGTEELQDFANVVVINVPFDSINSVSLTGGADFYTSASTDNIDNNVSSASSQDLRGYGTISYSRKNLRKGTTYSVKAGGSGEYDYTSVSVGLAFAKEFNEGNSELNVSAQVFRDKWSLIAPKELRNSATYPTSNRNSYNLQATFAQVLSKRVQIAISGELIYMDGLLSTPFHRVYFKEQAQAKVERLPDSRLKIPIGLRLNYFPMDRFVLRSYYRFYMDDWGLQAHTFSLETPIKISNWFTLAPFYRYNTQTGADYFAPYKEHSITDAFFTSDYDLSTLSSHKVGLGFRFAPLYGISRMKITPKYLFQFKSLDLRAAYYERSTGLKSMIVSVGLSFGIK